MALTSRRKLLDRKTDVRDAKLFIIATEGRYTEATYFESFGSTRVRVHPVPAIDDDSAPEYVLERLNKLKEQYNLNDDDQLWLVIDVDCWGPAKLKMVCSQALQGGAQAAISNPCFELWLCFHLDRCTDEAIGKATTGRRASQNLKKLLQQILGGYNEANIDMAHFSPYVERAIQRSREADPTPDGRWPAKTGTHVYKIVEQILESLKNS